MKATANSRQSTAYRQAGEIRNSRLLARELSTESWNCGKDRVSVIQVQEGGLKPSLHEIEKEAACRRLGGMTILGSFPYTVGSHYDGNCADTCCPKGD